MKKYGTGLVKRALGVFLSGVLMLSSANLTALAESAPDEALQANALFASGSSITKDGYYEECVFSGWASISYGRSMDIVRRINLGNADYVRVTGRITERSELSRHEPDYYAKIRLRDDDHNRKEIHNPISIYVSYSPQDEYSFNSTIRRDANETWNYKNAVIVADNDTSCMLYVSGVYVGHSRYNVKIAPYSNGSGQYQEMIYDGVEDGKPHFLTDEKGASAGYAVHYPTPCFTDSNGKHVSEMAFGVGKTVSPSIWEGATANSQGVYADSSTVDFKGFQLVMPDTGKKSSELLPASFSLDQSFIVKYASYMSADGSFELFPVYAPKSMRVTFNNDGAKVSGKADVKGVYEGFQSGYVLECTMLDSIEVRAKANSGYTISHITLEENTGAGGARKAYRDNQSSADKALLRASVKPTGKVSEACAVIYYDAVSAATSSIKLMQSPQHIDKKDKNGKDVKDCKIVKIKGTGDDDGRMVPKPAGQSIDLKETVPGQPYLFGAMPVGEFHAYWSDGTLDSNNDGLNDSKIPGYTPFKNTFGNQFQYIQPFPVHSKIYYNFVLDAEVQKDIKARPILGYLEVSDELLLSGKAVKRGLNGVKVFCNGQETTTKNGSFSDYVDPKDGYYELTSNNKFQYYDLYQYNVTFSGESGGDDVGVMYAQSPNELGNILLDITGELDLSDVKLLVEQGDYAVVDTSSCASDGYFSLPGGDHNYRLRLRARKEGVNLTKATLTFRQQDGSAVVIDGTEDANHSGIFTFDFNPAKKGIGAGALAFVKCYAGEEAFFSRDTGLKVVDSVGKLVIANALGARAVKQLSSSSLSYLAGASDVSLSSVDGSINMDWSGEFDIGAEDAPNVYTDGEERVVCVGFDKAILSAGGEKDMLMELARAAAEADEEAGEARMELTALKSALAEAGAAERAALEEKLTSAREALLAKEKEAERKRGELHGKLQAIETPRYGQAAFNDSLSMDLGYSFLMTFGFDEAEGKWFFKDMLLTSAIDSGSEATIQYNAPIDAAIGLGMKLDAGGAGTFVVEERKDLTEEEKRKKRYYVTETSRENFDVFGWAGSGEDRNLDCLGFLGFHPAITLSSAAGVAQDMIRVNVNGRAEYDVSYGGAKDGTGVGSMSASMDVSALNYSSRTALANRTFSLWDNEDDGDGLSALDAAGVLAGMESSQDAFLSEPVDILQPENVEYMEEDALWYESGSFVSAVGIGEEEMSRLSSIDEGGQAAYEEKQLANKIGSNADFAMAPLGKGRFGAVYVNVPQNRTKDADNAKAAYYTCYENGNWSDPVILEDDGTLDQYPHIFPLDDGGALIVWSSVNETYKDTQDRIERRNALDLHGQLVSADGTLTGDVMEITMSTKEISEAAAGIDDFAEDRAIGAVSDGNKLVLFYEKRQYEAGADGATVGDFLYPVNSRMASRTYDLSAGEWEEEKETPESVAEPAALDAEHAAAHDAEAAAEDGAEVLVSEDEGISEESSESGSENGSGNGSGNGSEEGSDRKVYAFLPKVMLKEDIDQNTGYYREGGTGTGAIRLENPEEGLLLESDAAACAVGEKRMGLVAYTVDTDGDLRTSGDAALCLASYDFDSESLSEPILLTGFVTNSDTGEELHPVIANPQFVRTDGALYLLYLQDGDVEALNISQLMQNESELVKSAEADGASYRFVDKTPRLAESAVSYKAPRRIVSGRRSEGSGELSGELCGDIRFFDAETDGNYIYVIWPEAMDDKPESLQDGLDDVQMWCVRASEAEGEIAGATLPIQITSHYGVKYDDVAIGVIDGKLVGLARKVPSRMITASEARNTFGDTYEEATFVPYAIWDDTGAYPVTFRVNPNAAARLKNADFVKAKAGEGAAFSFEVLNDGFDDLSGVVVTAKDENGNSVLYRYAPAETEDGEGSGELVQEIAIQDLRGGDRAVFHGLLPVSEDAEDAVVEIAITGTDIESDTVTITRTLSPDVILREISVRDSGTRNLYRVAGEVSNDGTAGAAPGTITLMAKAKDRNRKLSTIDYPALLPGETYAFDVAFTAVEEDFTALNQTVSEGGTAEELCLYASYEGRMGALEVPVYALHERRGEEQEFMRRSADALETEPLGYVTGVSVEAVKAVYDENGELTGGEVVSKGRGQLTLEVGESVDIQAEILTNSPRKGAQVAFDSDGKIVHTATGTEGLTYRCEFVGDAAVQEDSRMLTAQKEGTGKLKVYVYPEGRGYWTQNTKEDEAVDIEGESFLAADTGDVEDRYYAYPAGAIKTFTLDVDVVGQGKRAAGSDFTVGKIRYRILGQSEAAAAGSGEGEVPASLTIPATVKYDRKTYTVSQIDSGAFAGEASLKSVSIGKNVKRIGNGAFAGCAQLAKLSLGSGLSAIGEGAFKGDSALKNFSLPRGLSGIESEAFMNCESLTAITLPVSLKSLGDRAFYGCSGVKRVTISSTELTADGVGTDVFTGMSENTEYRLTMRNDAVKAALNRALTLEREGFTDAKGIVYRIVSVEGRTLSVAGLTDTAAAKLKSLSIPASVTYMGYPYSVTGIDGGAFAGNRKLTSITLPKTLLSIGAKAFSGDSALTSVQIPAAVSTIGAQAFAGCGKLTQVNILSPSLTLGDSVFDGVPDTARFKYNFKDANAMDRLRVQLLSEKDSFTDKNGLTYEILDPEAKGALLLGTTKEKLTKLTVPDTVEYRGVKLLVMTVEDGAFAYNETLKQVVLGKNVYSVGPDAFAGCTALNSINLKAVEVIQFSAFTGCTALKTLTIPKSVRGIGNGAFAGCTSLKTVTIQAAKLSEIGEDAFKGAAADATFKISVKAQKDNYTKLLTESGVNAARIR